MDSVGWELERLKKKDTFLLYDASNYGIGFTTAYNNSV